MANQQKKYSGIAYDQVVAELTKILSNKEGSLADLGQSSYGRTLIELFAATSDMNSTWIEQAFQESFIESANTQQGAIVGARSLGYSIRRPVPPRAGFGITLKRTGSYSTVRVSIPAGSPFTYGGTTLTTVTDCEFAYNRTDADYELGIMKLVSGSAILAQGAFVNQQFFSNGRPNQKFVMANNQFSDWFGPMDPNYSESDTMASRQRNICYVTSDASLTQDISSESGIDGKIYWRISRRGYQDPSIAQENLRTTVGDSRNYTCYINTANDGSAFLAFSDGINAAIPYGKIEITYFSTLGTAGNSLNVSGSVVQPSSDRITIRQDNGQESDLGIADFTFALTTDIQGGIDLESIESMRQNASNIYSSLDRLGDDNSYLTFIRRYSDVK